MTTETLEMIVGVFVPLLVSILKKDKFSQTTNAAIAVVVYAVVGVAAVALTGQSFTLDNIAPAVALFVTEGTVAYNLFWKNWGDPQLTSAILP